ncbi:SHOCT domain-containing protein [Halorussus aquaticus]|uniref:SHOCT domain-containing protein n=1 Tax=Halorussus aquaticus TaxID=2953748 RepID=A0ABD5Q064_9EURY|nr:SHOCT domain-containing protein [Halorussus aquaticus]
MSPTGDDRRFASMLAARADHPSVTADRLAGTADAVSDLETAPLTRLADGEEPAFCFECGDEGVGFGDPESTVTPERGGVYLFTDRRVSLQLGVEGGDESVSLPYGDVVGVRSREGVRRHRIDLAVADAKYFLWLPGTLDADDVTRAAEYVTYRSKAESPDTGGDGSASSNDPQSLRDRLERLGDAKSRGLIDEEEFQRRKEDLLDE